AAGALGGTPLVVGRAHDRDALAQPALQGVLARRLATTPALTALAIAPCEGPRAAMTPALPDRGLPGVALWPAALAIRASALRLALPAIVAADDPIVALVEWLTAARTGLEWRAHSLAPRRPAHTNAAPRLGARVEPVPAGLDPVLADAEPWPHLDLGWAPLRRVATPDGHRRLLAPGDSPAAGEFVEADLALVRTEPGRGTVPVFGTRERCAEYAPGGAPGEVPAGHIDPEGLPGGAEIVVFHDPRRAHDFVGHGDEAPPGCHVSRILGWGLAIGAATSEVPPAPPPDRLILRATERGFTSHPLTLDDDAVGTGDRGLVHGAPAEDRVPLLAARRSGGRATLTVDPFEGAVAGLEALGWIARDQEPGHPGLWRGPGGDIAVSTTTVPDRELLGGIERVPGVFDASPALEAADAADPSPPVAQRRALRRRVADWRRKRRLGGPPRTLIVAPWFSVGGGDRFLLDLIRILEVDGQWVGAALTIPGSRAPVDNSAAFTPHLRRLLRVHEDRPDVPPIRAIAEMIRDERIDRLFICGAALVYEHLGPLRAAFPGLQVVDQLFNDVGHLAANTEAAAHIDLTICAYEGLYAGLVQAQGRPADRVALAYIGIDTGRFHPVSPARRRAARIAMGLDPERETWGYLGRISQEKCLPNLVEALRLLGPDLPVQVVIQGEGPADEEVRDAVDASGLPIAVRGFAPDVGGALAALDVYVLPSRTEGIPLAVMEAMATGVLPVATAVGGLPELVHTGAEGYLVAPGDPAALALGLQSMWRAPGGGREQWRPAARRAVDERMSHRAMGERALSLLAR
ncbi:MAG: glycosyltransferase, partial [Miltoncostaeaceae bacterium]